MQPTTAAAADHPGTPIKTVTLFARPLPALTGLMRALGPELTRQQHRPVLGAWLALSTAPLHAMTRLGRSSASSLSLLLPPPEGSCTSPR